MSRVCKVKRQNTHTQPHPTTTTTTTSHPINIAEKLGGALWAHNTQTHTPEKKHSPKDVAEVSSSHY